MKKILVWDWPVRIGHWLLAIGFAIAWLTSESEDYEDIHLLAGATVLAIVSFRLLWGLVGTRYARFSDFLHGPDAVKQHLMAVTKGRPELHVGHNPTGGWAILVMLLLGLVTTLSGWAYYAELAGHWLKEVHEAAATMMLVVVCVHIAGVLLESFLLKENLISAMLSGLKQGPASEAISSARPYAAVVLVLWIVAVSWWIAS